MSTSQQSRIPTWRRALLLCLGLVLLAVASPYARAADDERRPSAPAFTVPSQGTDLWRAVAGAKTGRTQVEGLESGVLINSAGEDWRRLRAGPVISYSAWIFLALALGLLAYHFVIGSTPIKGGRSGETVQRWGVLMRILHWFNAVLFIILTITGLSLLFGRHVLIPVIGLEGFGVWAMVAKNLHNYLGPFFVVGVVIMTIVLLPANLPTWRDVVWLVKLGGAIGKEHPPVGRFNAGEKIFTYGSMATLGLIVCVTGLILDFPLFGQTREQMQLALIVHSAAAVLWICATAGHIYLGTVGVRGTFEAMWTGRVDANWAKQHHDLWYEEVRAASAGADPGAANAKSPASAGAD